MRKKIISITLSLIFAALIVNFLYQNLDSIKEIKNIRPLFLLPISFLTIVLLYLNGLFLKIISEPFEIKLREHFLVSVASSFFNLITPFRGGAGARAIYMKKKHNLSYSHFLSSLFGNYIIIFLVASFFALIIFGIIYSKHQIFNVHFFIIFLGILLGTLSLILFHFSFKKENFITSSLNRVLQGWKIIIKHPQVALKLIANSTLGLAVQALKIRLIFAGLGLDIDFFKTLYFSVISVLGAFLNITPGSLGITEGLYVISAKVLGISTAIGLLVALVSRIVDTIILLILGPISNFILYRELKSLPFEKN